jgi:small-conductance mechanosensitive channel
MDGRVDDIQTRATIISTADGHRAVIPNAVLFTNPVVVSTMPVRGETRAAPSATPPSQPSYEAEHTQR